MNLSVIVTESKRLGIFFCMINKVRTSIVEFWNIFNSKNFLRNLFSNDCDERNWSFSFQKKYWEKTIKYEKIGGRKKKKHVFFFESYYFYCILDLRMRKMNFLALSHLDLISVLLNQNLKFGHLVHPTFIKLDIQKNFSKRLNFIINCSAHHLSNQGPSIPKKKGFLFFFYFFLTKLSLVSLWNNHINKAFW